MSCDKKNSENCCKQLRKNTAIDHLVCICMGVMRSEIEQAIDDGDDTFEALSERLGVGTGCSSCIPEVKQILESKKQTRCCKS
ncbi:(2Fe-2S)-binding protein [Candidatus Babeliales bacterium]|nr:(2Fe-2S)-binding protein [Candidatus Babeliales bacterium]